MHGSGAIPKEKIIDNSKGEYHRHKRLYLVEKLVVADPARLARESEVLSG